MASYAEDVDTIAAYEDKDDYIMVFTSVPSSTAPHGAGAATSSSSTSAPGVPAEEEEQMAPPSASSSSSSSPNVHAEEDEQMPAAAAISSSPNVHAEEEEQMPPPSCPSGAVSWAFDEHVGKVEMADAAAEADAAPAPQQDAWEDEVTDEDEDDYLYQAHYDRADYGRSRHVKRSSGRRGRTKKASAIGRPRGGHLSHVAGALCAQ